MVNIDTVYQQVLAIANKEQRGYITPQEFSLFANLAQREIFEQYFYDINNFEIRTGLKNINKETTELVKQKLDIFYQVYDSDDVATWQVIDNAIELLPEIYRTVMVSVDGVQCDYLDPKEYSMIINSGYLTRPNAISPVYTERTTVVTTPRILVNNGGPVFEGVSVEAYRLPAEPSWGYFVVGGKALYDPNPVKTTHFDLHESELPELIFKILKFAGISMKHQDILQSGQGMETLEKQNEKQ
tara:strand:- start:2520 stop:3245 length:726 start_codon:yes stop_codon:yes gene_type:complete